ncbi:MAG: translocation/assembly module TamB [Myxococcaceae bacterium]
MQPSRRRWRIVLVAIGLSFVAGALGLRTERAGEAVCQQLRERVPAATGLAVQIGHCAIEPLTLSVEVTGVDLRSPTASADEPPKTLVTAERASLSLRGVFFGGVSLQDVELVRPRLDLSLDSTGGAKSTGCPVDVLRKVRVARLRVVDGSVVLHHPQLKALRVDGVQVEASLSRREAAVTVDARGGSITLQPPPSQPDGPGRTLRLGKISAQGGLDLEAEELEVQRAEASVEGVSASVSGSIDSLCDPAPLLDLAAQAWVPMDALPRFGLPLPTPGGQVLARLGATGHVNRPTVRGEVTGTKVTLGPFTPGDFQVRAAWTGDRVSVEEFLTRVGDGEVKVSGELTLDQALSVTARVDASNASLARALARAGIQGAWVDFPASVKGTVTGHLLPSPNLGGDIDFHAGKFLLASRAYDASPTLGTDILQFDDAGGRFHLGVTKEAVSFDDVSVHVGPAARTRVSGRVKLLISGPPGIDLAVSADAIDLADFGHISGVPWAGEGQARVAITGPFSGINVDGQLLVRDFKFRGYSLGVVQSPVRYQGDTLAFPSVVAQKGQTQYFAEVALGFKPQGLNLGLTAQLPDGRVEDVVDLLADLSPTLQNLQDGALTGRLGALIAIDSPLSALEGTIAARVHDVKYLGRGLGESELIARFEKGEALVLEPMVFEGRVGHVSAEGRWAFAGPLDFTINVDEGQLDEVVDPDKEIAASGVFSAKAKVFGTTDEMKIDGDLVSAQVGWKGHPLGPLKLDAHTVGRELDVKGTLFPGVDLVLHGSMRNEWPYTAHLDVDLGDLGPFLPPSASQLAVKVKGEAELKGPMREFSRLDAKVSLTHASLQRGEVTASNVEPVKLEWNAGALVVDSLELRGPTTELSAAGHWGPSVIDLKTRGSVDLRLLSSLVSSVERTQGRVDFTAAFAGPVKEPSLAGTATLIDGRFGVKGQDLAVRALSGRADFSESRVIVQEVQGFLNDGRVAARGEVRLEKFGLKSLELQVDAEDVTVQVQPEVPATFTGSLQLGTRDAEKYTLSGGLDVVKFRYTKPMALESLLASAKERPPSNDERPDEWLRLDVDLETKGDVRIDNDLARARLAGKLKLGGTNVKPVLVGVVETQEGAQASFRGNTYNVQRGQLQFNGLWPTFDLAAQSQIREYLVTVKAFGRFEDPKISFSSEPALPDADILSLLTLGVTSRERLTERSGAGLAAEAIMSASGLDQMVQRFLQQNVGLKDQQVKLTTSYNETTGTTEPAVSWESKIISDNVKVGVVQPVTGKGTRAKVDYRINQRVSARAQWDNQNQNTSVGNPGVELRFRFEWE